MRSITSIVSLILVVLFSLDPAYAQIPGGTILTQNKGRFPTASEITQSSGLALDPDGTTFWTHNDQGNNTTKLYNFTPTVASDPIIINKEVTLTVANLDWEDMTKDDAGNIYVAQTGHNCNQFSPPNCPTKHIYPVHRIPFTSLIDGATVTPTSFYFKLPLNGNPTNNCNLNDTVFMNCESVLFFNDSLFFFSKDIWSKSTNNCGGWSSATRTNLFKAPLTPGSSMAAPIEMIFVSSLQVEVDPGEQYSYRKMLAASISPDQSTVAINSSTRIWLLRDFTSSDFFSGTSTYYQIVDGAGSSISRGYEGSEFLDNNTLYVSVDGQSGRISSFDVPDRNAVLSAKTMLEGPFDPVTGMMHDSLRVQDIVPLTEPYTALGYNGPNYVPAPDLDPAVLAVTGTDGIVDHVLVELRDAGDPSLVVHATSALVQRDGDVVASDGTSPVVFSVAAGSYYVAVLHRIHLGVMTAFPITLNGAVVGVDLTSVGTATFGTEARKNINGSMVQWAGDVKFDGQLQYTGLGNDRDPILIEIGGAVPTNTSNGYLQEDVTMDGVVKYTGMDNDRDPILVNIGGSMPTNIRSAQLP